MGTNLADAHPEIAIEWHPALNGGRTAFDSAPGSSTKVWWLCCRGHEWQDTPSHRTGRGSGCPICAGKRILAGFNDLATLRPELAAEWDHDRNELTPQEVGAGSGRMTWWLDRFGHSWQATVNNRNQGTGCPVCAGQKILPGFNDLAAKQPMLALEWDTGRNGFGPSEISPSSNKMAWWVCRDGHSWQMRVANRTQLGQGCPVCAGQKVLAGFNDMATTAPDLAAEWHPTRNLGVTPQAVFRSTARRIWWLDALGHEWEASANERSNGAGCPFCSGQRILVGFNDLATRRPDLAAEWHPTKNGDRTSQMVTVMNGTRAWWCCDRGHEWDSVISSRGAGTGCPACAGQVVIEGANDLGCLWPTVAAQWHPTRNNGVSPHSVAQFSNRKFWFLCDAGHEWASTVNNRTHGQGCPECSERGGFKPGRPGHLYFLAHPDFGALKIGITNTDTNRLASFQLAGWEIRHLELFPRGADAAELERRIKRWWRLELGLTPWCTPDQMARTGGWTETVAAHLVEPHECVERIRAERAAIHMAALPESMGGDA